MAVTVYYSSDFKKALKKYSAQKSLIKKKILLFIENPHNPKLKTHLLKGELEGYCSFSINYHIRILFEFIDKKTVGFIDIGTHEIYRKKS